MAQGPSKSKAQGPRKKMTLEEIRAFNERLMASPEIQEMLREANTIGSKANDARILEDVIATKEELERIREQVENLE